MKTPKIGLLTKIIIAISLGIGIGLIAPGWLVRIFITFNGIFSQCSASIRKLRRS